MHRTRKKYIKKVKDEFLYRGCYFLKKDELDKVRKTIIINGALNAKIVGQPAYKIAALAGVTIPETTKVLIGESRVLTFPRNLLTKSSLPCLPCIRLRTLRTHFQRLSIL